LYGRHGTAETSRQFITIIIESKAGTALRRSTHIGQTGHQQVINREIFK